MTIVFEPESNTKKDKCAQCDHGWHGLSCQTKISSYIDGVYVGQRECRCPSQFVDNSA